MSWSIGKLSSSTWQVSSFPKCFKTQILSLAITTVSCFPGRNTHFVNFCENDCQVTNQSVSSVAQSLFVTPWTAACQASLSFTISRSLLKHMSIELVMPSNHLVLYCPLLFLFSIFPRVRIFSNESTLQIRWPKYWSSSFSLSPSSEYWGLISFRIDWFDLLAVQGTLESSPTPQFKCINSLVISLLYGPSLTSIHDYFPILSQHQNDVYARVKI